MRSRGGRTSFASTFGVRFGRPGNCDIEVQNGWYSYVNVPVTSLSLDDIRSAAAEFRELLVEEERDLEEREESEWMESRRREEEAEKRRREVTRA